MPRTGGEIGENFHLYGNHYHTWIEIVRITEMIYKTGRSGWISDDCELLTRLIWRHNILTEENERLKSCVVTLHNLIHLTKDIERFSSPDNFWCYVFERAVKHYIECSSNSKNLEYTFARIECCREFLKFYGSQQASSMELGLGTPLSLVRYIK